MRPKLRSSIFPQISEVGTRGSKIRTSSPKLTEIWQKTAATQKQLQPIRSKTRRQLKELTVGTAAAVAFQFTAPAFRGPTT